MIQIEELNNGLLKIKSDLGKIDIGAGECDVIICSKEELEYINEII